MRIVVLDTETTGLSALQGHRLIEIGCVELQDGASTGRIFHRYINPGRDVDADAERVHGLRLSFLKNHPVFCFIVQEFLNFIQDSTLVIHNARFDLSFLNTELTSLGRPSLTNPTIDTLLLAREKFPGSPANLDALCRHFGIDNTHRTLHGALLDAQLLSQVYIELTGGKQTSIAFTASTGQTEKPRLSNTRKEPRSFPITPEEEAAHRLLLSTLCS